MIKDAAYWTAWEEAGPLRERLDFARNLQLVEAMYDLARELGAFPPADPLEGIETDIRVARILNNVPDAAGTDRSRA
jgi:hypothetical protein